MFPAVAGTPESAISTSSGRAVSVGFKSRGVQAIAMRETVGIGLALALLGAALTTAFWWSGIAFGQVGFAALVVATVVAADVAAIYVSRNGHPARTAAIGAASMALGFYGSLYVMRDEHGYLGAPTYVVTLLVLVPALVAGIAALGATLLSKRPGAAA